MFFPWCAGWSSELKALFVTYVEAKQHQNVLDYDDLLLYWAQMVSDPGLAGEIGGPLRSHSSRRVSGYEPAPGLDPPCVEASCHARRAVNE